jgi:hypothetical protein
MSSNFETMAIANQTAIASATLPKVARSGVSRPMLIGMIDSARNAKAPIVAIPIPGERPFCLTREMLRESLRDMRITEASIQRPLPGSGAKPYLQVFAETDNGIKGSRKYLPLDKPLYVIRETLHKWAESQRNKQSKPKSKGKAGKIETLIHKLEKEKSKLGSCERLRAASAGEPASEYERAAWQRWHTQRTQRKGLTKIIAQLEANVINERGMYLELDKLFGTKVKRTSHLNMHEHAVVSKRGHGMRAYLSTISVFKLQDKPGWLDECYKDALSRAERERKRAEERRDYLYELSSTVRRSKEIDLQITDLQAMLLAETTGGVQ